MLALSVDKRKRNFKQRLSRQPDKLVRKRWRNFKNRLKLRIEEREEDYHLSIARDHLVKLRSVSSTSQSCGEAKPHQRRSSSQLQPQRTSISSLISLQLKRWQQTHRHQSIH